MIVLMKKEFPFACWWAVRKGKRETWMRLTRRPEAKKSRPNGTTTAAAAIAMARPKGAERNTEKVNKWNDLWIVVLLLRFDLGTESTHSSTQWNRIVVNRENNVLFPLLDFPQTEPHTLPFRFSLATNLLYLSILFFSFSSLIKDKKFAIGA